MSLLAKLEESHRAVRKKFLLHRLIVVASLPQQHADRKDLGVLQRGSCVSAAGSERHAGTATLAPRVLVMSHDLPSRLFQQWSYKVLNVQARVGGALSRDGPEEEEVEDTETLVSTTLSMLLKLGNHLLKATKGSKMPPGSVLDEVPEMIVPQYILVQLLSRGDLLSPQQAYLAST
ncbi:unnamed protein product [Coregonus sp. 'balchen']|nr:unnamed protein product [Coregonus sp. 'balchen']